MPSPFSDFLHLSRNCSPDASFQNGPPDMESNFLKTGCLQPHPRCLTERSTVSHSSPAPLPSPLPLPEPRSAPKRQKSYRHCYCLLSHQFSQYFISTFTKSNANGNQLSDQWSALGNRSKRTNSLKHTRCEQGSSRHGETPLDFKPNALTTRLLQLQHQLIYHLINSWFFQTLPLNVSPDNDMLSVAPQSHTDSSYLPFLTF